MKTFSRSIVGFSLVALLGVTTTARASDFNFSVPVNLQDISVAVGSPYVRCTVFRASGGPQIGTTDTPFPLDSSRNFSGTVSVGVNAASGRNPSDARYYECTLHLGVSALDPRSSAAYESRPGTTRTLLVSGEIPR